MEIKGAGDEEMQHPWLIMSQNEKQFVYNVSNNRFHAIDIPELHNKRVSASVFGWLVLVDINTEDCCLWHPVSSIKIELPKLDWQQAATKCLLSKPPTEPDCHILFIAYSGTVWVFCRIGDGQYVMQTAESNNEGMCLSAVTSFQGKFYGIAIGDQYQFVTLDFVSQTLELNPILMEDGKPWDMPDPLRSWAIAASDYLIESPCGHLLFVHKMFSCNLSLNGIDFRVFQVDVDRTECKELDNIGKRAIFVSDHGGAYCCYSLGEIKPNSIYYTLSGSRNLFIYNLEDRSTTTLLACSIAQVSNLSSCWVRVQPQIFSKFLN